MKLFFAVPCLVLSLLLSGFAAEAADYSVVNNYTNDPDVAGECLPINNGWKPPVFGQACRNAKDGKGSGGGGSSGAEESSSSGAEESSSSGVSGENESSSSSSGGDGSSSGAECPGPDQQIGKVEEKACDDNQNCTKDCVEGEPVCQAYASDPNTGTCECTDWKTPEDCKCEPKCVIQDPEHYPYCCSVTDKGSDYPCLKVCTLPNGDTVDIEENPPRCKKFKECCYGKRDDNGTITSFDPVETEPGDPRDYCKLKCADVCNDKQAVVRSRTASDIFPECCTPPVPVQIACACCRDGAGNQPSSTYCEYFRRFFSCDDATLNCPADPELNQCTMTVDKKQQGGQVSGLPEYDPNHDPYLTFDPRFTFCSGEWANRNCRYICRGKGILKPEEAPTEGIWAKDYIDNKGNPIENNYAIQVHGNCDDDEGQEKPIPWPPPNQALETCDDGSTASSSGNAGSSGQ